MKVIYPMDWLPLTALGSLIVIGIIWSIIGRIPITVTGQGVLVYPSKVASVRSPASGRLAVINVRVGDSVKKGIVLATIDQTELQNSIFFTPYFCANKQALSTLRLKTSLYTFR